MRLWVESEQFIGESTSILTAKHIEIIPNWSKGVSTDPIEFEVHQLVLVEVYC